MNRIIVVISIVVTVFGSCSREEQLATELNSIANSVKIHSRNPSQDLEMFNMLFPERYHEMAILYSSLRKETKKLSNVLDSLITEDKSLSIKDKKRFDRFYKLIDDIYIPRLDTVRGGDNHGNNYQYTQLTLLEKFITPLKEKVDFASSRSDVELIRLYLFLIEREVIDFIHEEALAGSVSINFIKPITIKNGHTLECYLAGVDTLNYPLVLIGKFKSYQVSKQQFYYKPLEVIDSIPFDKEKATINMNEIGDYEAIIHLTGPHGEPIQYKVEQ